MATFFVIFLLFNHIHLSLPDGLGNLKICSAILAPSAEHHGGGERLSLESFSSCDTYCSALGWSILLSDNQGSSTV
uniref:Secreted protein n=1 Tax=Aegilops tauschii subsp. strangulata TaxID=200361 RepID=A0A452ZQA5_AEGTS